MNRLETSMHLFQPPLYTSGNGSWSKSYANALSSCKKSLSWDPAAILSVLSFNYPCGDRTLIKDIKRQPWFSEQQGDGQICLKEIPGHGRLWNEPQEIAETLEELLCREAVRVCQGFQNIYILLSGGLDSRVIAGVLAKVFNEGLIKAKPIGVTWGLENSRDVVYGHKVAETLGLDWQHVEISADTLIENIDVAAESLACFVPPNHLHCMQWLKNVPKDSLVLAGSFGDSVGRAEYSGRHLIELFSLKPSNVFGLLDNDILKTAHEDFMLDVKNLHDRSPSAPKYVQCEHQMQGFYMRGMIAHVMSVINEYCSFYQMFTDPEVYSYIWSIHPACRDDRPYTILLKNLNPLLVQLPWARTNKGLKGRTWGAEDNLQKDFHDYNTWIAGSIYERYESYVDPDWFARTGLFNPDSIKILKGRIAAKDRSLRLYGIRPYEVFLWLITFRRFSDFLLKSGKTVLVDEDDFCTSDNDFVPRDHRSKLRRLASNSRTLYSINKKIRRYILKHQALKMYPAEK